MCKFKFQRENSGNVIMLARFIHSISCPKMEILKMSTANLERFGIPVLSKGG